MYGLKVSNGDLAVRGDGNVVKITGAERIKQELSHWLLEPLGTDTLYKRFGSTLDNLVGSPILNEYLTEVRSECSRVVQNYVEYQKRQINEDRLRGEDVFMANWKSDDIINSVNGISVKTVADTVRVTVKLTTAGGTLVTVVQES